MPANDKVPGRGTIWLRRLRRLGLMLICSYVGVILVLLFLENWLIFHPVKASQDWHPPPSSEVQDIFVTLADGTRVHAWWWPVEGSRGAVLYCHGNAGNLSHRAGSIASVRELLGESVLIVGYPGYGKSEGKPTEAGCYAAAEAFYDWLVTQQQVDPERILLYGGSLGGAVAVEIAARKGKYRGLVLAKTFCSAPEIGQCIYPWLPVRWLMRNKFDNLAKIGGLRKPVFIGNATGDCLVPFTQGEKLFATANEPKEFLTLAGDHNDPLPPEFFVRLRAFLENCEACPAQAGVQN